jgi:hypothetical protein
LNSEYPFASIVDHGFSAMVNYDHRGAQQLVRDFILENCICDSATFASTWGDFVKEGGYCSGSEPEAPDCDDPPVSLYTTVTRTETDGVESVIVEDWAEDSEEDSLCGQIGSTVTLAELCESESRVDECSSGKRFIVASSSDYCLKEISETYARQICTVFTGCGTYVSNGYKTLLRSGPIHRNASELEKRISRFELEAHHVDQVAPSQFRLRIGHHSQAVDPNDDQCGIIWDYQDDKDIDCLGGDTSGGHATAVTRPAETYEWPLFYEGSYLYFELSVENSDVDPIDTGGDVCVSRISLDITPIERRRF